MFLQEIPVFSLNRLLYHFFGQLDTDVKSLKYPQINHNLLYSWDVTIKSVLMFVPMAVNRYPPRYAAVLHKISDT